MIFKKQIVWLLTYVWYPLILAKHKRALVALGVSEDRAGRLAELQIKKQMDKMLLRYSKEGE